MKAKKKRYSRPKLLTYGSLAQTTRSSTGGMVLDAGGMGKSGS